MDAKVISLLANKPDTLNGRLQVLHECLRQSLPQTKQSSCLLYDEKTDLLKKFLSSHHFTNGGYDECIHLKSNQALFTLCQQEEGKLVSFDTDDSIWRHFQQDPDSVTAFIIPIKQAQRFIGFVCFETEFLAENLNDTAINTLILYAQFISMMINEEFSLVNTLLATVRAARDFTDFRDFETGLHLDRMACYARIIATHLAKKHRLSDEFIEHMYLFARLHDIGKIGISDSILNKPGRLDDAERSIMKTHVSKGVDMLEQVLQDYNLVDMRDTDMMRNIVACHHEYIDGSGYPKGLKGDDIPLEARIATVADIFDALTCHRPYKKPWPLEDAIAELEKMQQANKLDAECVAAVRENKAEFEKIMKELSDDKK
ncbi:HD-GYP domain-containing protein [Methylophaga sulfidovorans]|uniref:Metal dependent phosphohydrolase n=1 Tax=Methylophaga sulfidovorans TaxID=45496 RepID=A0A1I4A2V5_9GAMM|nr:HD-GYP domain-containing protein [Methylophaga sulfidovorans]SFK50722.1 metal dependent phosphohydrolase [Methylophaga sulfidovorans]